MVAEENLPWSAGCCGTSRTIVSIRSRCHISRRGDFLTPGGLLAPPGEYGEQVPVVGSPRFRADGHAELARQAIDMGLDGARPGRAGRRPDGLSRRYAALDAEAAAPHLIDTAFSYYI